MPQTLAQRLTVALPIVGLTFLLASLMLPVHFAVLAWGLAMLAFLTALGFAIVAQRERRAERPTLRRLGSR
ncbi:hypothetical protein DC434_15300 [Microbacterium sp. TPD7012]|nr:hypothetical protein DC434_15300 [Microbacterium sp. TPD7012]